MSLYSDLFASVHDHDCEVRRVCVGLYWTAVESRYVGLSPTWGGYFRVPVQGAGELAGRSALDLAGRYRGEDLIEVTVGLAALNSMFEPEGEPGSFLDASTLQAIKKIVTLVGTFPSYEQILSVAKYTEFTKVKPPTDMRRGLPDYRYVPHNSELVIVDSATLIDGSFHDVMRASKEAPVFMQGPGTPMHHVLFEHGLSMLGGVRVVDADALFASVMEGACSPQQLEGLEPLVLRSAAPGGLASAG